MTDKNKQPTNSNKVIISFPAPHTRRGATSNMMIGWGYYTWAKEMIENKFGLRLEQCGHYISQFNAELPEYFDRAGFASKLYRLYNTSVLVAR